MREYIKNQLAKGNLARVKNKSTLSSESTSPIKADYRESAFFGDSVPQTEDSVKQQFSVSDNSGKTLTKGQQEYFKDSKVRDENGNLKVMYHGTPNGDYTVFKEGTYFTDNKEYADRYQSTSASSIKSGKVATNPKT